MRLFVSGGRRLPFGLRLGVLFDPADIWRRLSQGSGGQTRGSFLYIIQGVYGHCKVGVSRNPRQRLRELQTGHPTRLELVWCAVTPGSGYSIENQFRRTTHAPCTSGEWYQASWPFLANHVSLAAVEAGEALQPIPVQMVPRVLELAEQGSREETPLSFPLRRPVAYTLSTLALVSTLALLARLVSHLPS